MNKAKFPAFLSTAVVCYLFWLIITGQIAAIFRGGASAQVLVAGIAVSALVSLFSSKYFIHTSPFYLFHPARLGKLVFYCLVIFPWELIKANVDVALRALNPALPVNPGIVKIPVGVKSEYGMSMVANSITLTPGTITMDTVEQDGKNYFYIHWINVATEDPVEAGDAIKGTMEKWIGRIFK